MSAYLIFDIHVTAPEGYEPYRQRAAAGIVEAHRRPRTVVRGGDAEPMEGEWDVDRVVVLEFDLDRAGRRQAALPRVAPTSSPVSSTGRSASAVGEGKAIRSPVQGV